MTEEWRDIPGYEGLYQASNYGRIKSLNYKRTGKEQLLKPSKESCGYLQVRLYRDGKPKWYKVHRLVWEAFNGPISEGMQINHINEDKTDNRLENCNLMTPKENTNWGTRNERIGVKIGKLRSKPVEQYTLDGVYVCTWPSTASVERELGHLGFDQGNISLCCIGKHKTHKGFIWKYAE